MCIWTRRDARALPAVFVVAQVLCFILGVQTVSSLSHCVHVFTLRGCMCKKMFRINTGSSEAWFTVDASCVVPLCKLVEAQAARRRALT